MKRVKELIARASKDFELAKRHKQLRDYVTATILYTSAVEKVLKALFINREKRDPPKNASLQYLARHVGVPEEVSVYMSSMEESSAMADPADFSDMEMSEAGRSGGSPEVKAFYMDGLVKRLLDYVYAYSKS